MPDVIGVRQVQLFLFVSGEEVVNHFRGRLPPLIMPVTMTVAMFIIMVMSMSLVVPVSMSISMVVIMVTKVGEIKVLISDLVQNLSIMVFSMEVDQDGQPSSEFVDRLDYPDDVQVVFQSILRNAEQLLTMRQLGFIFGDHQFQGVQELELHWFDIRRFVLLLGATAALVVVVNGPDCFVVHLDVVEPQGDQSQG